MDINEEFIVENAKKKLRKEERQIWEALDCPDLVANITIKRSAELNKRTKGKRANWSDEVRERDELASKHFGGFSKACDPNVADSLFTRIMCARVERDLLRGFVIEMADALGEEQADLRAKVLGQLEALEKEGRWDLEGIWED